LEAWHFLSTAEVLQKERGGGRQHFGSELLVQILGYFAFLFNLLMHPDFLLFFPATRIPIRAMLDGFNIRSVFSVLLVCLSKIVRFCVLYFSVMLLELSVAIVYYIVS